MNQPVNTEESNPLAQRFMQSQQAKKNQDTNTEPSANGLGISECVILPYLLKTADVMQKSHHPCKVRVFRG